MGRSQRGFGLGTAALLERDRGADPNADLLGDLRAGQRLRAGEFVHLAVVRLLRSTSSAAATLAMSSIEIGASTTSDRAPAPCASP